MRYFFAHFQKKEDARMKLVIAEKPSVAQSLARIIGATKRQEGDMICGYFVPGVIMKHS